MLNSDILWFGLAGLLVLSALLAVAPIRRALITWSFFSA